MKTKRRPKEYKQQGNNAQLKQIKTITRKDKPTVRHKRLITNRRKQEVTKRGIT